MSMIALLAQTATQPIDLNWLRNDPTGQKVALAVLVVGGILLLWIGNKVLTWSAGKLAVPILYGLVLVGAYFAVNYFMNLGTMGWVIAILMACGALVMFALGAARM